MTQVNHLNAALAAVERPIFVQSSAQLSRASKLWKRCDILGVDTEFLRERTYQAKLGLVQVSDGHTVWLIDPLAINDLQPLTDMLGNADITKLFHSPSEDLEVLNTSLGVIPDPIVDTQLACALLGQPQQMGYHTTIQWAFDIAISKEETRSNWLKRPLTDKQMRYAALDVCLLPILLTHLQPQLNDLGRWEWLVEECKRQQKTAATPIDIERAYLRLPGLDKMNMPSLKVAIALARWRELQAQDRDLPRTFIMKDPELLSLANEKPDNLQVLEEMELLHPKALKRHGKTIIDLISTALAEDRHIEKPHIFTDREKKLVKTLQQCAKLKAEELNIAPAVLASRKDLERLLRRQIRNKPPQDKFQGWRQPVITQPLLECIDMTGDL